MEFKADSTNQWLFISVATVSAFRDRIQKSAASFIASNHAQALLKMLHVKHLLDFYTIDRLHELGVDLLYNSKLSHSQYFAVYLTKFLFFTYDNENIQIKCIYSVFKKHPVYFNLCCCSLYLHVMPFHVDLCHVESVIITDMTLILKMTDVYSDRVVE